MVGAQLASKLQDSASQDPRMVKFLQRAETEFASRYGVAMASSDKLPSSRGKIYTLQSYPESGSCYDCASWNLSTLHLTSLRHSGKAAVSWTRKLDSLIPAQEKKPARV
eukprot:765850-Hanusia_phi.AAC.3